VGEADLAADVIEGCADQLGDGLDGVAEGRRGLDDVL